MKNNKKCQKTAKIVLKNGNYYVIIRLPNFVNKQTILQTNIITNKEFNNITRGKNMPINIKNAANYLIQLFYSHKRTCRSQVLQKILIIAQLKCLKELKKPLFLDGIVVKPACFSIDYVSKMYSTIIFESDSNCVELDKISDEFCAAIQVKSFDVKTHPLSYSYEVSEDIPNNYQNIINSTFSFFGVYTGNAIGECMKRLSLHTKANPGDILSTDYLQKFICDLEDGNLDESDIKNPIVQFLLS